MLGFFVAALALLATATAPSPASIPMQLVNNHVFVDVALNGAGPFRFIVDSGAGNLLDPAVAAQIGAAVRGRVRLAGVGAARETGGLTTVASVRIGAATFSDQRFVVAATRATLSAAEGPPIDGLIGREIIASGITILDYAQRLITLRATTATLIAGGTAVLPVTLRDGLPQIPCSVGGVAGSCTVDTGSRLAVSVLAPFARRNPAVVPAALSAPGIDGYGIGGAAAGRLGLLASLSFGNITLKNVVADFSLQELGVFADEQTAANVGGGVWQRFTLIFDLKHRRIGLRPNDTFDGNYAVDRSGLFLIARDRTISVLGVRPKTPAARAGILPGDILVAVDGRRYSPARLPELRSVFEARPDTVVQLQVARGLQRPRMIALRLGDYL